VEENFPAADSSGDWSYKKNGKIVYTKSRFEAIEGRTNATMKYHQNVCDFLQSADLDRFPGGSPLEQAMSLLKMLSKKQGGSGGGENGEPLPIFQDNDRPEDVADDLHETMDMVDKLSQEEQDMIDPNGENHDVTSDEDEDGERSGNKGLNKLKIAEDLVEGSNKRIMLDISRQLDEFTKLQVRKKRTADPDPTGDEVQQRPIKHLGELSKVAKPAWTMRQQNPTYFLYQAVSGQLPVRERITRNEKKQAIYILVDGSGSMGNQKHYKASGVVMNRLKAVISGDATVWVSVFDTDLSEAKKAETPEQARELIKQFTNGNFKGGGTDIAAAVRAAHKKIEEATKSGEALYRPEVVVLTDEDTSISGLSKSEIPGTKVHGFAIERKNPGLVNFAKSTGGVGIENF